MSILKKPALSLPPHFEKKKDHKNHDRVVTSLDLSKRPKIKSTNLCGTTYYKT